MAQLLPASTAVQPENIRVHVHAATLHAQRQGPLYCLQAKDSSTAASQDTATASRPQQTDTTRPDHVTAPPPAGPLHAFHPQPSPLMDGVPARGAYAWQKSASLLPVCLVA